MIGSPSGYTGFSTYAGVLQLEGATMLVGDWLSTRPATAAGTRLADRDHVEHVRACLALDMHNRAPNEENQSLQLRR